MAFISLLPSFAILFLTIEINLEKKKRRGEAIAEIKRLKVIDFL